MNAKIAQNRQKKRLYARFNKAPIGEKAVKLQKGGCNASFSLCRFSVAL